MSIFKKIKKGFKKLGSSIAKGMRKVGRGVKKGFSKITRAFGKLDGTVWFKSNEYVT